MKTTQIKLKHTFLLPFVALCALSTYSISFATDTTASDTKIEHETGDTRDSLLQPADKTSKTGSTTLTEGNLSKSPTPRGNPLGIRPSDHCFVCIKYHKFQEIRPSYRYSGSAGAITAFVLGCWLLVDKAVYYYKHWKYCRWLDREGWRDDMPQANWSWTDPTSWFKN